MPQKECDMAQDQSPIWGIYDHLMANPSRYVILDVDPGLGKSTIVPFWYADRGYRVLCSEPLVATAKGNCEYTSAQRGTRIGSYIGYRAGPDRVDSFETRVLYCSDELGFVRELNGHNSRYNILLMNDVHDWTIAQLGFEALAWKGICDGTGVFEKVVIMSGTMNAGALAKVRGNAPIYRVRGAMHHIDVRRPGKSLAEDARTLLAEGFDVLAFLPGEGEIGDLLDDVGSVNAKLLMFYSDLDVERKNAAFEFASVPRLVAATNALEKGRNFVPSPGRKLAILDSGMERVMVTSADGIERLSLQPIPLAKREQRKRRTGRMDKGVYIDHCPIPDSMRAQEPVPEIDRVRTDRTLLRYIVAGCDINQLPLLHKPKPEVIERDLLLLQHLEAITPEGQATELGKDMSRFKLDMRYARSIIKAAELGVVGDVINLVALAHHEGIRDSESDLWETHICDETESDLLIELDLWRRCYLKSDEELEAMGVYAVNYKKVNSMSKDIRRIVRSLGIDITSTGNREAIITAWISGFVDDLFHCDGGRNYSNGNDTRRLATESVVKPGTEWVVGIPISLQVVLPDGATFTRDILKMVTTVRPEQLMELAPHLIGSRLENFRYYPPKDNVICWRTTTYGPHVVRRDVAYAHGHHATMAVAEYLAFADAQMSFAKANKEVQREIIQLHYCEPTAIRRFTDHMLSLWYLDRIGDAESLADLQGMEDSLRLTDAALNALLGTDVQVVRVDIRRRWPDTLEVRGSRYPLEYGMFEGRLLPIISVQEELLLALEPCDVPTVGGIAVGLRLTDGSAAGSIVPNLLRRQQQLQALYDQATALASQIDWTRMDLYGLKPEENILKILAQVGSALEVRQYNAVTDMNRLINITGRLAKVVRKYNQRIASR